MKISKKIIIVFTFIFTIILFKSVNAASVSTSSNKTSINVGDEFDININLNEASVSTLTIKLSVDISKVEYLSGPANSNFSGGKVIYTWTDLTGGSSPITGGNFATFKFRAKSSGIANFNLTGEFFDIEENNIDMNISGISITINEKQEENIKIDQKPIEPENKNIPSNINDQSSNNNIQQNLSSNSNLKGMQLDVEGVSPIFNKNITQYLLIVDKNVNDINVIATPEDYNAKVNISGNKNLQIGNNKIVITVTAQNGSQKIYIIDVTKTENMEDANANLESLAFENFTLTPEFSADITNYSIDVDSNIETLNIIAIPEIEDANVTINKPETLNFGENTVEVIVVAKDGITKKVYTINVNRKSEELVKDDINQVKSKKIYYVFIPIIIGIIIFCIIKYIKKKKDIVYKK